MSWTTFPGSAIRLARMLLLANLQKLKILHLTTFIQLSCDYNIKPMRFRSFNLYLHIAYFHDTREAKQLDSTMYDVMQAIAKRYQQCSVYL